MSVSTTSNLATPSASNLPASHNNSVAIGAGVGVPLGVIAIGVLAYLFLRYRRLDQRLNAGGPSVPYSDIPPYPYSPSKFPPPAVSQPVVAELGRNSMPPQELPGFSSPRNT
jgi:hypothetical protein